MLELLNSCVENEYDFFYMPVDFKTNCNLGFGYVSLTSTDAILKVYNEVCLIGRIHPSSTINDGQIPQVQKFVR